VRAAAGALVLVTVLQTAGALGECPRPPEPGDPLPGLTTDEQARFAAGRGVFQQVFEPATGLGPLFNAPSCVECHNEPVVGGNGDEDETHAAVSLPGGGCDLLLASGGPVFQTSVTPALREALGIDREPIPDGAPRATRSAPDILGFGLLDAVPASEILARADSADRDRDGISGRVNRFFDGRIGKFGRKGFLPSLDEFNAGAFVIEMGVTNLGSPSEGTIGAQPIPDGVDPLPEPELSVEAVALVNDFVRFLAPPRPRKLTAAGERGRLRFRSLGCVSCHVPALRTGTNRVSALDRKTVYAYTDLLIHDMGSERADICFGGAEAAEFRTEPLMGVGLATRFMHDGAARTLEEAIELHGGEGSASRGRFRRLSPAQKAELIEFLESL
jgi:CxxC motif-containing protein (DUF1111 family)